jgi:hypothetical protein
MSPMTTVIEVNRPADEVFAYVTNPTALSSGSP